MRCTEVESGDEPASTITFEPFVSVGSLTHCVGGLPVTTSGAVSLTTLRCGLVPYRLTVSEYEETNVLIRSQPFVSLTNLRSTSG